MPNAISTNKSFLQLSSKSTSIHSLYHPLFIFTLISSTLSKLHINILTHTNTLSIHIPSHIHIHTILCYTIHISSAITHHHSSRIIWHYHFTTQSPIIHTTHTPIFHFSINSTTTSSPLCQTTFLQNTHLLTFTQKHHHSTQLTLTIISHSHTLLSYHTYTSQHSYTLTH